MNRNGIHEKFKVTLKSENACCYSVQNFSSSSLLSKNINIEIYRATVLPVCMGVKLSLSHCGSIIG